MATPFQPHPFLPSQEIEPGLPALPEEGMSIGLGGPPAAMMLDGVSMLESPAGMEFDFEPARTGPAGAAEDHDANLAEHMSEGELSAIAQQIEEWVDADVQGRKQWHDRLAEGLELLGVVPDSSAEGPFKLTRKVNHPLIAEAAVQFQARAVAELIPPGGPAKAMVLGDKTQELEEQETRVSDYLNYQLMVEDKTFYPETDRMLFVLSYEGSQFKKVYRDHLLEMNVSRWIRGEDFIVPYGVTTLQQAPRYTHQQVVERNDMKKLQASGYFRKVELSTPVDGPTRNDRIQENRDRSQGQENVAELLLDEMPHTAWECHCDYDLPGFEDPDGIGLPYIITVDKESRTVLSIYRNWKQPDPKKRKRIAFVHFPYLPGDGFYSYGLIHAIGGLGYAATGLLKSIMIGAAFASMNGGFKSKDAKLPSNVELEYGKWQDTEMTADELAKAFYTPNFKGPSEADFKVLGLIIEAGQRFSSTTESMVGDASNTGPVGTTVALIEQGSKVFSGIHKRLHVAQGEELQLLAELNGEHLPEEGYPYKVQGADRQIFRADFDGRVDVVPVSDPNIFSSTQRIAIGQAVKQAADEAPDIVDRKKAYRRLFEAMRVPDVDDLLIDHSKVQRCDPVTENALMLVGKPAKAYQDQDHESHITVHMDQLHRMEAEKNPLMERLAPATMAHVAEHMAYDMRAKMAQAIGMPLPALNLDAEGDEPVSKPLPPEIENQIAQRAAMAIQQMRQAAQQQAASQPGGEMEQQAQALQQQAGELEQARADLAKEAEATKREKMQIDFSKREGALRQQLTATQEAAKKQAADQKTKALLDEAVRRVEKALGGGKPKE